MGGPDIVMPRAPPAFGVNPAGLLGPPNAYDENNPLPPPWYPQPGPPPGPAPGVIPGDPGGSPSRCPDPARTGPGARPDRRDRRCPLKQERGDEPRASGAASPAATAALAALAAVVLTSCGSWHGIANVPLPGGPGTGPDKMTIYVQMPDTLALNVNSRVRVADVYVGRVRSIELKNWVATLTLDLQPDVKLPENTLAKIGQTSLLGSQHVQLDLPPDPSPQQLKNGDTIPLKNSSAFPTTERVLASIGNILRGGGIPNLEVIQTEINNVLTGRADQIRGVPEPAGHVHRRTEPAAQRHHPRDRFHQPAADDRRGSQQHPGPGAHRIPAADQAFRRHPRPVRRRRRSPGPDQPCRRQCAGPDERQPAHQPAESAAAAQAAGQGVAVPDRRAQADTHRTVPHRERAEG